MEAETMPELDRWVLHRLAELDKLVRQAVEDFDFPRMFNAIYQFCAVDLSAFYFDIRKDVLYCDPRGSPRRRAARTVLDRVFYSLTAWLAPLLCFTAEEVWLTRFPSEDDSIHLQQFPEIPAAWLDPALAAKWERIRTIRRVVTGALEVERREKRIGASLQASPTLYLEDSGDIEILTDLEFAEIAITSGIEILHGPPPEGAFVLEDVAGVGVSSGPAQGEKCVRCWQVLPTVGQSAAHPELCRRCLDAVEAA